MEKQAQKSGPACSSESCTHLINEVFSHFFSQVDCSLFHDGLSTASRSMHMVSVAAALVTTRLSSSALFCLPHPSLPSHLLTRSWTFNTPSGQCSVLGRAWHMPPLAGILPSRLGLNTRRGVTLIHVLEQCTSSRSNDICHLKLDCT